MSTKTTIKRVALVAAVALTLGGLSSVSASAAYIPTPLGGNATDPIVTSVVQDATTGDGGIGGVAGPANSLVVNIQQKTDTPTTTTYGAYVTVSGAGATISAAYKGVNTGTMETSTIGTTADSGATIAANGLSAVLPGGDTGTSTFNGIMRALRIATPSAGTITVNVYNGTVKGANPSSYNSTADATLSITVNATAVSGTLVATKSGAYDTTTVANEPSANYGSTPSVVATVQSTSVARYLVFAADANGTSLPTTTAWSATVTGPGSISATSSKTGAKVVTGTLADGKLYLFGDGTSGSSTITFTVGSTVVATKSVAFYSTTVASLTATTKYNVVAGTPGGYTLTSAKTIFVVAKDSSGNAIVASGANGMTATSSNTAIATVAAPVYDANAGGTGVAGFYVTATGVAEGSAVITIADSTGLIKATATVLVTTGVAAKITTSTDAASYDAGTAVTYTITATDAAGNPIADGSYVGFLATAPVTNVAVQGFSESTTATFLGGKYSTTFYAPLSAGNVTVTGGVVGSTTAVATALQASALPAATFSVNGDANSSLAVDAANAATDAANAAAEEASNATEAASEALAAVNALATTVASLIAGIKAQLTALTALVKKLQK